MAIIPHILQVVWWSNSWGTSQWSCLFFVCGTGKNCKTFETFPQVCHDDYNVMKRAAVCASKGVCLEPFTLFFMGCLDLSMSLLLREPSCIFHHYWHVISVNSTSSALAKLSKVASGGTGKTPQTEKKETPQERLKRIMSKQLNKQSMC